MINKITIFGVAAVVAGGAWWVMQSPPTVDGLGGTWTPSAVSWHEADGAYRAAITFAPHRASFSNASVMDVLRPLCTETLKTLDVVGQPDLTADDVYRIDLNFELDEGELGLPVAPMIPVLNGTCQFDLWEDDFFFPTYAGRMSGWFLSNGGASNSGDLGVIPAFEFRPLPNAQVGVMSFDFAAACTALLSDPAAWVAPDLGTLDRDSLSITARGAGAIGLYQRQVMTVADGTCTERAA